jgi:salicylate hydroxylase
MRRKWTCSRFGFQKVFRQVAEERGIQIRFSTPVQTVDLEDSTAVLADGSKLRADLVIGADGESTGLVVLITLNNTI